VLQNIIAILGMDNCPKRTDRGGRARKIERFLSQPFHVAEVFTARRQVVDLADTIKGFPPSSKASTIICRSGLLHGRHHRRSRREWQELAAEAA